MSIERARELLAGITPEEEAEIRSAGKADTDPSAAALERTAIDDAYQEQIRTEFGGLIDNMVGNDPDPKAKFLLGLAFIRKAREIALEAIGAIRERRAGFK